ncbi:glycosyltransferase, partial [Phycicoccus flavus]
GAAACGAVALDHDAAAAVREAREALRARLDASTAHVTGSRERVAPPPAEVGALRAAAAAVLRVAPDALVPADLVAAHARSWVGPLPHQRSARLVADAFAGLPWPEEVARVSGLAARLRWAGLSTRTDGGEDLDGVRAAARGALAGSDAALADGRTDLALGRWCDAWELLCHRELHTDVASSPLVDDPAGWLGDLVGASVTTALRGRRRRVGRRGPAGGTGARPSVLVVTGLSGDFHPPVLDALEPAADVALLEASTRFPRLRQRGRPSLGGLREVAATAGLVEDARQQRRVRRLRGAVAGHDVVLSDWADASTVWLSRLVPPRTRLVVRVHSVDVLDAWFPLVDWDRVDEVLASPAVARLVAALLTALGAGDTPVTEVPPLVGVRDVGPEKDPGARTTLGMIGWARRVKDVAWALDLLERDASWRLVLVGQPLTRPRGSARSRAYQQAVLDRLASPGLRDRVDVVGWSDDVAGPLRRVGVVLSTSRRESLHYGLVEGAASGAVPVVRDWPLYARWGGARAVFPAAWVVGSLDEAAVRVRACTADDATWERERHAARKAALDLFHPERAAQVYRDVVLGPVLGPG